MKKRYIDLAVSCIFLAGAGITLLYQEQVREKNSIMAVCLCLAVVFFFSFLKGKRNRQAGKKENGLSPEFGFITELALLNEEDKALETWELYGKTAVVIGRDCKENQVDIDLGQSAYASMVDIEHAVLNFSAGNWYVEDLGSANGISLKKAEDGRTYKLSADTPCQVGLGDCLYVGLNRLIFR